MRHLKDRTVLVLGLGESGLAMARWCARFGAAVRVWDSRRVSNLTPPNAAALAEHVPNAQWICGELAASSCDGVQLLLKSPGLSPHDPLLADLLKQATALKLPVQGELDLFARALVDLKTERAYAPRVIAITGTNGKTTTTAMTALLVARAGKSVATAGNIGPTMLQTLADALDAENAGTAETAETAFADRDAEAPSTGALPEVWVLELSSFQLDGVTGFEPSAATVLNITQDHLDWHATMPAYIEAKSRIFGKQAVMVINRDDALVEQMVAALPPAHSSAGKGRAGRITPRHVVRFGLDAPKHPGDFGLLVENGMAWLVRALEADETLKRGRAAKGDAPAVELHIQRLMPADALHVRGRHNAANALAALALASAIDCPLAPMLHGLREYRGEPHRVEHLISIDGIGAFDDSKGTNVGATVAALNGLGEDKAPAKLVVILGGDGKGQDFAPLLEPVRRHARAVATLGRDAQRIEQALASAAAAGIAVQRHATLAAATRWCFAQARPGDAVLLSPACASLDMFRNYAHRAEVFAAEVHALAAERGGLAA